MVKELAAVVRGDRLWLPSREARHELSHDANEEAANAVMANSLVDACEWSWERRAETHCRFSMRQSNESQYS